MEKKQNKELEALLYPFDFVRDFFNEKLKSDKKPLNENIQIKVREKLHPALSLLSSWIADRIMEYFENPTDSKTILETSQKGAEHYLVQLKSYVSALIKRLKEQITPEKASRTKETVRCGIDSILIRNKDAATELFKKQEKEANKKAKKAA